MLSKNTYILYIFLLIILSISLFSCKSSFVSIKIQTSTPAKIGIPDEIRSLTFLNRSINSQYLNFNEDTLQNYFYRNKFQVSKIFLDSLAADTTLKAMAALFYEAGRFDVVVPVERNLKRQSQYNIVQEPLDESFVSEKCKEFGTDGLLVLENLYFKITTDMLHESFNDPNFGVRYYYYASIDLKYDALLRIYKPGVIKPIQEIKLVDTISWDNSDEYQVRLFKYLPSIKDAFISGGIKVALDFDSFLSPIWTTEKRGYFLIENKNDPGQKYMSENNYLEAYNYWIAKTEKKTNKSTRSKAEYNIALFYELNGDIENALKWALKSYYTFYRNQTDVYIKRLNDRKIAIQ